MTADQNSGQVPVVTAARGSTVEITLANNGQKNVYTVTKNDDYVGSTKKVTVKGGSAKTVGWPASQVGYYYDVVITANTRDGFRRRYAGRIA